MFKIVRKLWSSWRYSPSREWEKIGRAMGEEYVEQLKLIDRQDRELQEYHVASFHNGDVCDC